MKVCTLGSGSKGNSFVFTNNNGDSIMVDAGFSCKRLIAKLTENQVDISKLKAVLVTHNHEDHIAGCRVFCNSQKIPLYASFKTSERMALDGKLPKTVIQFEPGESFEIADFAISAFAVQHDATDPVGFTIVADDKKIGIATDLGVLDMLCKKHLTNCHGLILESNYDKNLLYNSLRPLSLKQRINSNIGHLNNLDTIDALDTLLGDLSKFVMLVHLSRDCNNHEIVQNLLDNYLQNSKKCDIITHIACQESISEWFEI